MLASERFLGSLWSMKIPRRVFVGSSLAAIAGGPLIAANSKPGPNARRGGGCFGQAALGHLDLALR